MIIINSDAIARELLNKRSAIYSDRPVIRTQELYVLLLMIQPVLDLLMMQSWTDFQYWAASVWRDFAATSQDFPSSHEGRNLYLIL